MFASHYLFSLKELDHLNVLTSNTIVGGTDVEISVFFNDLLTIRWNVLITKWSSGCWFDRWNWVIDRLADENIEAWPVPSLGDWIIAQQTA